MGKRCRDHILKDFSLLDPDHRHPSVSIDGVTFRPHLRTPIDIRNQWLVARVPYTVRSPSEVARLRAQYNVIKIEYRQALRRAFKQAMKQLLRPSRMKRDGEKKSKNQYRKEKRKSKKMVEDLLRQYDRIMPRNITKLKVCSQPSAGDNLVTLFPPDFDKDERTPVNTHHADFLFLSRPGQDPNAWKTLCMIAVEDHNRIHELSIEEVRTLNHHCRHNDRLITGAKVELTMRFGQGVFWFSRERLEKLLNNQNVSLFQAAFALTSQMMLRDPRYHMTSDQLCERAKRLFPRHPAVIRYEAFTRYETCK